MLARSLLSIAAVVWLGGVVHANETTWSLSQTIQRDDESVFWTSPTAIDTSVARHDFTYEITGVSIFYGGILTPDDETSAYAAENSLSGSGALVNYPGELWSQTLTEATTETQFDLSVTVGADGFGRAAFTGIQLGSLPQVFNPDRTPISALRLEATITLTESNLQPGDYDNDGDVDQNDYTVWRSFYGSTTILLADGNADGVVNAADYAVWRDNLTQTPAAVSVPEPAAVGSLLAGGLLLVCRRR